MAGLHHARVGESFNRLRRILADKPFLKKEKLYQKNFVFD